MTALTDNTDSRRAATPPPGLEPLAQQLLTNPLTNRGTAFSDAERDRWGLRGLLPPTVETLQEQAERAWQALLAVQGSDVTSRDLERHINLRALQDTNEVLFYKVLSDHIADTLPLVYTPTVGAACERFSEIYRRPRGLFISYPDRDRIREILRSRSREDVDVIVVTDGQRILGLGDQGAGGMGIPIGKLSLYTAVGGIDPARTLPIILDVGTDNPERRADPMYLGWRHERITGGDYYAFVDAFVQAVRAELPNVLLQWEDFAGAHAAPILDRYRDQLLTFNDDIQGTAAVVAGAMAGAAGASGVRLAEQRIVMLGAGAAGIGVLDQLVSAMVADGASEQDAIDQVHVIDIGGLLLAGQQDLTAGQRRYAKRPDLLTGWGVDTTNRAALDLATVVRHVHPTCLIGLSTAHGAFTQEIVQDMASAVKRPIIMPLSNPTSHSEAAPQDLADWTNGRALVATGSPYPPVTHNGATRRVAQCNNVYIFPAMGLGVVAAGATRVTDAMFTAAATALGQHAPAHLDPTGAVLPEITDMPAAATTIAEAVAIQAVKDGVAPQRSADELRHVVRTRRWSPAYPD
ncbi:MAG TPA: NAD-dependent malic enzyme [Pseudonocardia sp.]|uniref:NAD-dependent malic enzyme n=1 Tax=Pseudonocardia sp. TaxID=60912 RepID=UPI002B6D8515|nr:NAD-dependent malic enzyme [Pseudonocardia sp.]HTF53132.1 NAD-dependent malic enzyme [Pseudonocardia sp.]